MIETCSSRSADFQSAVSPASSRQTARSAGGTWNFTPLSGSHAQRIGNPRYSRLETCATMRASRLSQLRAKP